MGFLNRAFRNRGLIENLSRDPVARIEPIAPLVNPIGSFPQISEQPIVPIRPLPIEQPIVPLPPVETPIPRPLERLPFESPRDNFLSIQRLDDPIVRPLPVSPPTNIGGPPLDTSLIPEREILERPIMPSSRGIIGSNPIIESGTGGIGARPDLPQLPRSSLFGGKGMRDDFMFIERLEDPIKDIQPPVIPDTTPPPVVDPAVITPPVAPSPVVTPEPVITEPVLTPDQVIESAPTMPAAVATDVGAVPTTTIPQDIRGQVDPVLAQQDTVEMQTDPLLRALYFGTADQPGFINQLQQATANLIGSDVPLQQTAGLSELEQLAQDRALADLGVAEPFVGESADLIRGTTRQFDPSMTQQFFNPFEDQVVQQTIQDVLEAGEKRDVAQRARDIQTGGLSAFGSRARLTAADRQRALGRGLSEALGGIRQAGFGQAQRDALTTFAQQRQAEQQAARDIGQVGSTLADLRARERAGLVGFGQTGRGIEETGLSRLFQQQVDAQGRPLQALQLTGSLLPQFQAGSTRIDSQYRLPTDPSAAGLGAAFNAYAALAPKQGVG
jgi:hypothetical protein